MVQDQTVVTKQGCSRRQFYFRSLTMFQEVISRSNGQKEYIVILVSGVHLVNSIKVS